MKARILRFLSLFFTLVFLCDIAHAVWVWNPKTGKWSNPKYETKGSPKAQMQHAETFEKKGKWEAAAREYRKVVKTYPTSPLAPEALMKSAHAYEKAGYYAQAFKSLQMIVEKYPSYPGIQEVVEEEYRIANLFLSGKRKKMRMVKLALFPSVDTAIEIYQKVVENFPYGDLADDAQLRIGIAYQKKKKYPEAIEAYKKLLKEYKGSPLRDEAKFRMGVCAYKQSKGASYDHAATDKALEYFNEFLREYPGSKRVDQVQSFISELNSRKARGLFQVAAYYDKIGNDAAAEVYYLQIIKTYPDSQEAREAAQRLEKIQSRNKPLRSGG